MGAIIHRVCSLDENVNGHPRPSQFTLGDIDAWDILPNNCYIAYGGTKPASCWPRKGLRPRYLAWKHSANLYAIFIGNNPTRKAFLEESPRNGMRGRLYCEQGTHGWRWFRCSGWDNTDPENPVWVQERMFEFGNQPPAPSTISPSTPWTSGNYEIHEIVPSLPCTIAGFDLPEYASHVEDPTNGDEID